MSLSCPRFILACKEHTAFEINSQLSFYVGWQANVFERPPKFSSTKQRVIRREICSVFDVRLSARICTLLFILETKMARCRCMCGYPSQGNVWNCFVMVSGASACLHFEEARTNASTSRSFRESSTTSHLSAPFSRARACTISLRRSRRLAMPSTISSCGRLASIHVFFVWRASLLSTWRIFAFIRTLHARWRRPRRTRIA